MLDMFFDPKAIAIIGASSDSTKLGYQVLANLVSSGFPGAIYPVNPTAEEILGLKVFKSVLDTPGPVDMVVIMIPSRAVAGVMRECGQKGVKGAVIITAGFREAGPEGVAREKELLAVAAEYGIRIIGPNCLGIIDTFVPMNVSFAAGTPKSGSIAFMSQSGALCTAILDYALAETIGFSHFVSLGNKSDIDEVSLLEAWGGDDRTNVIIAYIEGLRDGAQFIRQARETARNKPIIAVKSGRTASGSRAVSSHTGSLAGSDAAYDAGFKQAGVMRAETVQELFDYSIAFAYQPLLKGNRIAIVTNAGGPGVMATDALELNGMVLASLSPETQQRLVSQLPAAASAHNPVDVLGDARSDRYMMALQAVLEDPDVDGVLVIVTPQTSTEIVETARGVVEVCAPRDQADPGLLDGQARGHGRHRHPGQEPGPQLSLSRARHQRLGAMYTYRQFLNQPQAEPEVFEVDARPWRACLRRHARKVAPPSATLRHRTFSRPMASPRPSRTCLRRPMRPWPSVTRSAIRW